MGGARPALRNEPPFGPLRVPELSSNVVLSEAAAVLAFVADAAAHPSLHRLCLRQATPATPAALDALVDCLLAARHMRALTLDRCRFPPGSAPSLARLLGGGPLTELAFEGDMRLDGAGDMAVLAAALRSSGTLTSLCLRYNDIFTAAASGLELLRALRGHPSLRKLQIYEDDVQLAGEAVLDALAGLVAVDAPALTELQFGNGEGDAGLLPLLAALPANTHLRRLELRWSGLSDAFVHDALLPSVRENTGLRHFRGERVATAEPPTEEENAQACVGGARARGCAAAARGLLKMSVT